MSQHALKLAEALEPFAKAGQNLAQDDNWLAFFGNVAIKAVDLISAAEALSAYLASDEHTEDVQRAQAEADGFQGLAGKAEPK